MTNAAPQTKKPTPAIKKAAAAKAQNIPAVKADTKVAGAKTTPPKVSRTPVAAKPAKQAKAPKPVVEKGPTKREMAVEIIRDWFSGTLTDTGVAMQPPKEELFEHIVRELQLDKGPQPEKAMTNAKGHFYFIVRKKMHEPLYTGAKKKARLEANFGPKAGDESTAAEGVAAEVAPEVTAEVAATVETQADQPASE